MPRYKEWYTERLTIKVTSPMLADLTNVATKSNVPISAVVRQAVRNYLDGTDLTLGTKRTFDRRFQADMKAMQQSLKRGLAEDMTRIEQELNEMQQQAISRLEHTLRRDIEQLLSKFSGQILAAVRERDEPKGKKRF